MSDEKTVPEIYDDDWAANYARRAEAAIPGRTGLYRCLAACFADLPAASRVLVVGCGTGEELLTLAEILPTASFVAVDPADAMLQICRHRVSQAGIESRVLLVQGYVQQVASHERFAAATSVLVAQHIGADAEALDFFRTIANRLLPGGRLYTADLHIGSDQDRTRLIDLWQQQARLAGIESDLVEGMAQRFQREMRPRSEKDVLSLLQRAGFSDVLKPFSSLLYGAWYARVPSQGGSR